MVYTNDEKKKIDTLWSDIENMTEEEYKTFCLKEAERQVKRMNLFEYSWITLKTLYWLSPFGFIFSNDMSLKCYRLASTAM